jgi:hypothetical protein
VRGAGGGLAPRYPRFALKPTGVDGAVILRYLTIAAAIAAAFFSLILARAAHLFALDTAASVPGWIRHGIPDSERPLTNGDFRLPFYRHGFDWSSIDSAGARVEQFHESHVVRISLSGEQPDHCVLLRQYVPLSPGSAYNLAWRTVSPDSGLAWHLRAMPAKVEDELVSDNLSGPGGAWQFRAPASEVGMLSLEYSRPLGRVRAAGTITLESVSLEKQ